MGRVAARIRSWVSGATQIDLAWYDGSCRGLVNWSTDWLVELDPRNPKPLEVELDPGLELVDVEGGRCARVFASSPGRGRRAWWLHWAAS